MNKLLTTVVGLAIFSAGYALGYLNSADKTVIQPIKPKPDIKATQALNDTNHQIDLAIAKVNPLLQPTNLKAESKPECSRSSSQVTKRSASSPVTKYSSTSDLMSQLTEKEWLERKKAIRSLLKSKNPEVRQQLIEIAKTEEADSQLRQEIIESINWGGEGHSLSEMVQNTSDINAIGASISASQKSSFSIEERQEFERSLINLFVQNRDNVPQAAIVDYFNNEGVSDFNHFLTQIEIDKLAPELQEQINIFKQRHQPANIEFQQTQ